MLSVMPTIITASAAHDSTKLIFPTVLRMSVTTGEVNGKNKVGAYVGFKRFYSGSTGARIEPDAPDHLDPESVAAGLAASNRRLWQAVYDANCSEP